MTCIQGPLDGCDMPERDAQFFMVLFYGQGADGSETKHVYGKVGDEWHYQPRLTKAANGMEATR